MTDYSLQSNEWLLSRLDYLNRWISEYKEDAERHGGWLPEEEASQYSECLEERDQVEIELDFRKVSYREEYPD